MPRDSKPLPRARTSRPRAPGALTHFDASGAVHMVDVSAKDETHRVAVATGEIRMQPATLRMILSGTARKGDVLGVARVAAVQGAKRASELIALAHPIALTRVSTDFATDRKRCSVRLTVTAETVGRTGVEMEALAAVSAGLLTVYDMCKAVDRGMTLEGIRLLEKSGGKSGRFVHPQR
ncbi:MAG: molybdenum cofactor biosynthesis protein C [Betaproteobacteria bacterium RBG_16_64_9]|nr:MAG: molybdenum cofactor biosynthesis protein C [Betaproteobacteria bacterium RBG_16_64_9]OGA26439.1 MAG: molybdenum cofactor biosynthesis protein C [Betaproteobacteria bacterium RIFCSPLOWO2_02_FULL_65_24]OGA36615.1 MAG: molybdenum cofactor biosynthesis protein C [Betaproteobacteria bacterium RIFCSPLOWO2_12_FULL_62_13b]